MILKANQHIDEPIYTTVTKIEWNSPNCFFEIWCSQALWIIACCDLHLWPLTPKAHQHIYEPNYIGDKIRWNSLH